MTPDEAQTLGELNALVEELTAENARLKQQLTEQHDNLSRIALGIPI